MASPDQYTTVWFQCSTFQAGSVQQHYCIDCILGLFSNTYVAMLWFIAELDYGLWRRIFSRLKSPTPAFIFQHRAHAFFLNIQQVLMVQVTRYAVNIPNGRS